MSKTIYYIGAGAGYGKRDKNGEILKEFLSLQRYIGIATQSLFCSHLYALLSNAKYVAH